MSGNYNEDSIRVLEGLEAVRLRPAMYIGGTDDTGLHHLFQEVLDNCVDEVMAGRCSAVQIVLEKDGETITIEDDGSGIPVGVNSLYKISTLELVLTKLHAGGKFSDQGYSKSGGLHGVGVSCVNALSENLTARVWRDGGQYKQEFSRGEPKTPCERIGNSSKHGTAITFKADPEIFKHGVAFDEERLLKRIRETAFLNGGLRLVFESKKSGKKETFQYAGGISDYIRLYLHEGEANAYPAQPFYYKATQDNIDIELAFQYKDYETDAETLLSYANNIPTANGGTHVSGFKTAFTRVVNQMAKSSGALKEKDPALAGDDIREGITAVISVRVSQPQFEGQTKGKLSSDIEGVVNKVCGEGLTEYFEKNPAILTTMARRAQIAQQARAAAKREQENIKRKSFLGKSGPLPSKLADCRSEDTRHTELFLCEGASALGSAMGGRDSNTQAILPLRGKILNAKRATRDALMKNEEIRNIISAIGIGTILTREECDLSKIRYGKVIILCDADDDGSHIQTLILTLFFEYLRPLLEAGHVYIAVPPLYRAKKGTQQKYFFTDDDLAKGLAKMGDKWEVTRFKGLGEMNPKELGETTMKVGNRRIIQVRVGDIGEAEHMTGVLMGDNVESRKTHIIARFKERDLAKEMEEAA